MFSPAKINLLLAVTGRRADGYHDLLSVAAPLEWGDELAAEPAPPGRFTLACDDPALGAGEDNLVLRAARAFAAAGGGGGAAFDLRKRLPVAAGLGGGSSNAAAALRLLNGFPGGGLPPARLAEIAAGVGSDCALFLAGGPAVMRGRGERVEPLPAGARARLAGRRVLVFKPGFGVPTAGAYALLAARSAYLPADQAEARLAAWLGDASAPAEALLFNSFEEPVFAKHAALPALFARLRRLGARPLLSGSGSACFALLGEGGPAARDLIREVRDAWGESALAVETRIAG